MDVHAKQREYDCTAELQLHSSISANVIAMIGFCLNHLLIKLQELICWSNDSFEFCPD